MLLREELQKDVKNSNFESAPRTVASLKVLGGQEFHFPHFFLKFRSISLIFPQTLLIFFLILGLWVGDCGRLTHPRRPWLCYWAPLYTKSGSMHLTSLSSWRLCKAIANNFPFAWLYLKISICEFQQGIKKQGKGLQDFSSDIALSTAILIFSNTVCVAMPRSTPRT